MFHPVCLRDIPIVNRAYRVKDENTSISEVVQRLCALRIRATL
jgi:predicted CopG family antitoxin